MTILKRAMSFSSDRSSLQSDVMKAIHTGGIPLDAIQHIPLELLDPTTLPNCNPNGTMSPSLVYKPWTHPYGYDVFMAQNKVHWLPEEVPLAEDVRDWKQYLTDSERNLVQHIFRLFTQNDMYVSNVYMTQYPKFIRRNELLMGAAAIANIEGMHQVAYSYLLDTIGMPESEYSAFLSYSTMTDKYDYMHSFKPNTLFGALLALIVYGGMMEGVQLFASFIMLLNFPRDKGRKIRSTMKGMGQIVQWSMRDEDLHVTYAAYIARCMIEEYGSLINMPDLIEAVRESTKQIIKNEHHFVDLAYEMGPVAGLTPEMVKLHTEYRANMRLVQFGLEPLTDLRTNPVPWADEMVYGSEHANFFENRSVEYSKASTLGTWEEAFAAYRPIHKPMSL